MKKEVTEKNENIKGGIIGFVVAVGTATTYRIGLQVSDAIFNFVRHISVKLDSLLIFFGLPGLISFAFFYFYSKNIKKALVVGFMSILFFLIIFILTLKEIPGVP